VSAITERTVMKSESHETVRISLPGSFVLAGMFPPPPPWSRGGRDSEDFITWIIRVGWDVPPLPLRGPEVNETVRISLPGSFVLAGMFPPSPFLVRRWTRQ
jgi:hypothetical protein